MELEQHIRCAGNKNITTPKNNNAVILGGCRAKISAIATAVFFRGVNRKHIDTWRVSLYPSGMGQGLQSSGRMQNWLREPLVHFLLAGLGVFLFSAWRGEPVDTASRTIAIDAAQVSELAGRFAQSWRRTPTASEIDGLIRDHIKEEIYYREALRLGLDNDDAIIRQRLRSKMEFLATSETENAVPEDTTLQAWLNADPARYAIGATYSFDQIFLNDDNAGAVRVASLKAQLAKDGNWQAMGDAISLPRMLDKADTTQITRAFGDPFTAALVKREPGSWFGPVLSGFGTHLVRVRHVQAGRMPKLAEVRQSVENDWRAATVKLREAKAYQTLLDGYDIRITKP
jgi:peptidyl-prolyl cis-trans isomerase C